VSADAARLRAKTWLFTAIVVFSNAFGDYFLKRGVPDSAQLTTPLQYIAALFQPWMALGIVLLIVWQTSRMALLSWADLSYVLPVTAIGYVLVAFIGKTLLHETITTTRWAGIVLIVAGVALVSFGSAISTVKQPEART